MKLLASVNIHKEEEMPDSLETRISRLIPGEYSQYFAGGATSEVAKFVRSDSILRDPSPQELVVKAGRRFYHLDLLGLLSGVAGIVAPFTEHSPYLAALL